MNYMNDKEYKEYKEYISSLKERMYLRQCITVDELRDFIKTVSLEDREAGVDATTIFYNVRKSAHIEAIAANSGNTVRMIERTAAYEVLNDEDFYNIVEYAVRCENPNAADHTIQTKTLDLLYGSTSGKNSFMSTIQCDFIAQTEGELYIMPEAFSSNSTIIHDIIPVIVHTDPLHCF